MAGPKKSLGQHWLKDRDVLADIADEVGITKDDTILEIGPGLGTLTSELLRRAKKVIAVELDSSLARKLPGQFPGTSLEVVNQDILQYDLRKLPAGYKVVANVPYYITSKIVRLLTTSPNKPASIALLVQKEVAVRMAAKPGDMSILAVSAQLYADVHLGSIVPAELFTPPPKVDSQVVVLAMRTEHLVDEADEKLFFRVVKAGFSAKRKKLRSSIASGLGISKEEAVELLAKADVDPDRRAEDLALHDWLNIMTVFKTQ
jgi:16S rRNA (adenine1518-N6/adenine1519-N6)-dimethyltransferase